MTRNLNEIERFFNPEPTTTIQPKQVGFKRLTEDAVLPTKAHATDSGYDLVASEDVVVRPGDTVVVKTGIAVNLPEGFEAVVRPRSGITSRTKLRVAIGTIDNGFTGEIGIITDNIAQREIYSLDLNANEPVYLTQDNPTLISGEREESFMFCGDHPSGTYLIRKGDKLAQLVITRLPEVTAVEIAELGESDRGTGGFGSTGVNTKGAL